MIFEGNFLSISTLRVVKIADIKFIFNMLSNICHNLMIYILSPCFLPTVQLQLQHPLLVYQTELDTCQRCQLGEKSAERGATDLDLGKLLFTYRGTVFRTISLPWKSVWKVGGVDERMAGEEEKQSLRLIGRLVVVLETKAHLLGGVTERNKKDKFFQEIGHSRGGCL